MVNKQPRILPCGHTFCTPCIISLVATGTSIVCPKCSGYFRLPVGGVAHIPINTDLRKMREREDELAQSGEKCQLCKKKYAKVEYICSDCPFRLVCQACADRHKKLPVLQSHNIVPLEKKRTNEPEDHEKCVKHDQLLEYFCSHCEDALCAVCLFEPTHEDHSDKTRAMGFKNDLELIDRDNCTDT